MYGINIGSTYKTAREMPGVRRMEQHDVVYFEGNFFSTGNTRIFNEQKQEIGSIRLKRIGNSMVEIYDQAGNLLLRGKLGIWSHRWFVYDGEGKKIGVLKSNFPFFPKKYDYLSLQEEAHFILKPPYLGSECGIFDKTGKEVAHFERRDDLFDEPVYMLENHSPVTMQELVMMIRGACTMQKRHRSAASTT